MKRYKNCSSVEARTFHGLRRAAAAIGVAWVGWLGACLPAMASPVDASVSQSYLSGWGGRIHYCRAGLCTKLGRRDMPQADPASFRPLSERYAADRQRVYHEGLELEDADPASLRVLGPDHAVDRQSLYVRGFRVREPDAATARYLPRHYVMDRHKVWYGEFETGQPRYVLRELVGAHPERFQLPVPNNDTLATDGTRLYLGQHSLPLRLGKDFRVLEGSAGLLALVSDARLHVRAQGLQWPDPSAVHAAGGPPGSTLLSLPGPPTLEGTGPWRLLNGRWLIVEQDRRWRLVRDDVKRLRTFPESIWHAVVDDSLWYAPVRSEDAPFEVGPAAADLQLHGPYYVVNGARVFYKGRPVEGADPATFRTAPEGMFRFSVDAMDQQWLYGLGQRVERNDDAGRQRQRMPR
jgi:hypothetical protein